MSTRPVDLLATAAVARSGGSVTSGLPQRVDQALGEPEELAYFLDRDSGEIIVVPESEVTVR